MANAFLTTDEITLEALAVLENQLTFTRQIRRKYDSYFAVSGAKIGDTLRVRKPARYLGRSGQGYNPESITETQVSVTLSTQFGVDFEMSTSDLTLRIDEFSDRILKPAIARIANKIDQDGLALYSQVYQSVGTPGTTPSQLLTYLSAKAKLDNSAAPNDGERVINLTPTMEITIANALTSVFNPTAQISKQYLKGSMGKAAGFDWYMDQNCSTHTVGTITGSTPLVQGGGQTGASVITDGWNSGATTLNLGDVVQFASVFAVNPQSYASTGALQDFVVTATTSDTLGTITIPISPSIVTTGAFQNVTGSPADNAAITVFSQAAGAAQTAISGVSSPQGMAYHPDFATLVCADLVMPKGTDMAARKSDDQLGLSLRFIRDYDPVTDQMINRFDILYGWAVLRPELACRVAS